MTSDLDDTVVPPPRRHDPVVELEPDLEATTITWKRPVTAPIALVEPPRPPGPPAVTTAPLPIVVVPDVVVPDVVAPAVAAPTPPVVPQTPAQPPSPEPVSEVPDDTTVVPALVNPPEPGAIATPVILNPDLIDNVWLEPVPAKPQPFRIRLDDGTLVPIDQPVYLGRRPSVPRIHPGGIPLLVTLDSPQREVSSTHLVLTTVGGAIVARDLKSSNGSVVRVPGTSAHTLLGGESAVVTPGTIIELGDGNSIELLAPDHPEDDRSH